MISVPTVKPGDMVFWHCVRTLRTEPTLSGCTDVK